MEEFRIDMRKPEEADPEEGIRCAQLFSKSIIRCPIPKNTMLW